MAIGWFLIYSVDYDPNNSSILNFSQTYGKQFLFIGISLAIIFMVLLIDSNFIKTFAYPAYGLSLVLLILVALIGPETQGARSWFKIAGVSIQPSEFAKVTTCLALAHYLGNYNLSLKNNQTLLICLAIIFAPMALVVLQGDAGSALVFSSFIILLFREGMPKIYLLLAILVAAVSLMSLLIDPVWIVQYVCLLLGSILFFQGKQKLNLKWIPPVILVGLGALSYFNLPWHGLGLALVFLAITIIYGISSKRASLSYFILSIGMFASGLSFAVNNFFYTVLEPHQQDRILVWLNPSQCDPQGSLYNLLQSKTAIGSGGLSGKGFLKGTFTKFEHVPEQNTDFIFCTMGEEHGLFGSLILVMLFLLLLLRIIYVAERQRSRFSRIFAYGVCGVLFFHFLVNIGMTMGLMPIIGIPLPFISYGGSSLVSFSLMMAILLKLDSQRLLVFR